MITTAVKKLVLKQGIAELEATIYGNTMWAQTWEECGNAKLAEHNAKLVVENKKALDVMNRKLGEVPQDEEVTIKES